MAWLAQGYEPTYRTINRFQVKPAVQELLRQCFVKFRCQLGQEGLIKAAAIFIDGTEIEANANKLTFVWRKSIEKYSAALVEKSNQMYNELLEKEIIPGIERESLEELSDAELLQVAEQLDEVIAEYDQDIAMTEAAVNMRKYTVREALIGRASAPQSSKKGANYHNLVIGTFFHSIQLVMFKPLVYSQIFHMIIDHSVTFFP